MLDELAKIGQVAIPAVGALIAFSVYRLNSEKLFLDMLAARRAAMQEVLDTALARETETQGANLIALGAGSDILPEQRRFWRSKDAAAGLFGPEVGVQLDALDAALRTHSLAVFALRGPDHEPGGYAARAALYQNAVSTIFAARQGYRR